MPQEIISSKTTNDKIRPDWCIFCNSIEEDDVAGIEEVMQECWEQQTESLQRNQSGKDRVKWNEITNFSDTKINFGHSTNLVWTKAKEEVRSYRDRSPKVLRESTENAENDALGSILDCFLGELSPIALLRMDTSDTSCSCAIKFLLARCTAKAFRLSATESCSNECGMSTPDSPTFKEHCRVWSFLASDVRPTRHVKPVWEQFQDNLSNKLRDANVGDRSTNVASAHDDEKHAGASDEHCTKNREGLKVFVHPNKRKGIVGHAAASPFAHLTRATLWEKNGETQTERHAQIIKSLFSSSPNLGRILFASDRGH